MKNQTAAQKAYIKAKNNFDSAYDQLEQLMEEYELAEQDQLQEKLHELQDIIYELELKVEKLSDKLNAARKAVDLEQDGVHIQFNKDGSLSGRIFIAGF